MQKKIYFFSICLYTLAFVVSNYTSLLFFFNIYLLIVLYFDNGATF